MTLANILRLLARRWYVILVGLLLTGGWAAVALQTTGVYTARTTITLMAPAAWAVAGNSLTDPATTVVGFARVVEKTIRESPTGQLFASADTPLYGSGIREGELVYLPNAGGQWAPNYNRPVLIIDVVGTTSERVAERVDALTAEVAAVIEERQDAFGVAEDQRIRWQADPETPEVAYVGNNRTRMLGGIVALGCAMSAAAAVAVDVLVRRRRERRADAQEPGHPGAH